MLQGQTSGKGHRGRQVFSGGIGGDALIRTPCGPRRADAIRSGDLVVTRTEGLKPVRAVWMRKLTQADMKLAAGRAPIRLKPRAVGPMMPTRDLLIAADHKLLVPGYRLSEVEDTQCCLMTAGEFAEASDDAWTDRNTIGATLYTFIFDTHQVFCASGLPVESFQPSEVTLPTLAGKLRKELMDLFPSLSKDPTAYPAAKFPQANAANLRLDSA